jgi:hypothetical protein
VLDVVRKKAEGCDCLQGFDKNYIAIAGIAYEKQRFGFSTAMKRSLLFLCRTETQVSSFKFLTNVIPSYSLFILFSEAVLAHQRKSNNFLQGFD